jgi:hypothetical protein
MSTIEIIGGIFLVIMMVCVALMIAVSKNHGFMTRTHERPLPPPQKARTYESMTYSELSNLYLLYKQKIEAVAAEIKRRESGIGTKL